MIVPTAAAHGILFQSSPTGRRFARIEDFCSSALHGLDELSSERCHPGKALNKIQRDAFRAENGLRRSVNRKHFSILARAFSIVHGPLYLNGWAKFPEGRLRQGNPRDNQGLARYHGRSSHRRLRHEGQRRHIPAANVFGQRKLNNFSNFLVEEPIHTAKMKEKN
jgi:hypothetical protein